LELARRRVEKREMQSKASRQRWKEKIEASRKGTPHLQELSASRALRSASSLKVNLQIKAEEEAVHSN
jgi:hypothetical protein